MDLKVTDFRSLPEVTVRIFEQNALLFLFTADCLLQYWSKAQRCCVS